MKRRVLTMTVCAAMMAAALAGCGKKEKGKVYYMNFKPEAEKAWQNLAAAYTKETGIDVKVTTAAAGTYEQQLTSEMSKDEAPTLFQVNGPVGLANWKEHCYDLKDSDVYKQLKTDDFALKDGDTVNGIAYCFETYGIIYNKTLLNKYLGMDGAVVKSADEINSFAKLKAVADDIQAKKAALGVEGAFTSAGMDSSSDWRFKTHLANLPIYYEYKDEQISSSKAVKGTYLDQYKSIFDLYITDSTCEPKLLGSKNMDESTGEFATGKAVFYQNGTWAYGDITGAGKLKDEDLGMLPIYIGAKGEETQGLCTGSENYWCVNKDADKADIEETLKFMNWVVTSETGKTALSKDMGFVTPFKSFEDVKTTNRLNMIADEYIAAGKTPVSWNFSSIPSENWKNDLGAALTAYAAGTGDWEAVKKAFVDGWAKEYAATHN
ncbi:MAG: ABC transporter substrate-binding protein [Lachnospiraceae bacterium]|nr:ABC transporter substrate-binding protein [Lachnospiraceae bacterium]MDY5741971.1 ABC transporter substrate-binding protein [Lachnospiraceae bacterium]